MLSNNHFKNRKSIRLKEYDYSQNGAYFITICTQNKKCLFGKIENDEINLNDIGEIAREYWQKIEVLHAFVEFDSFIVMPNHIHGIIIINRNDNVGACQWHAPTSITTDQKQKLTIKDIQLPGKGIPALINHYKGAVKKWTNKNNKDFFWQRNYYEHIIRNENAFREIRRYILNNPLNWKKMNCLVNDSNNILMSLLAILE